MAGPLAGLRVVDATGDEGRFAGKLLVELGADVVRVNAAGSSGAALRDPAAASLGGSLDWWYDGGKRRSIIDLETDGGREQWRRVATRADVLLESERPGRLAELGLDHADLLQLNPALVQISITPFGRTGPWADWAGSDLVHAALGGTLAVTGAPDRPLNLWGRMSWNYAGFTAALCALAGVRAARNDGRGRHFDLSVHECVTTTVEHPFVYLFFDEELPDHPRVATRQGALHWLRVYDLAECADGYLMITPTPSSENIVSWMVEEGQPGADEFVGLDPEEIRSRGPDLMHVIREFVRERSAMETWWEAQRRHCALAAVHNIEQVAAIPQFEHRQFFQNAQSESGAVVRMPGRLVRYSETPVDAPRAPASEATDLEALLSEWGAATGRSQSDRLARPLNGLRVADFTWVLAGPFCTRMLGDLGADVIRVQNEERSTNVNRPDYPYFFVWNRSKRSATLNMKHPEALDAARRLIENSDILIENYSAGVLDRWGLDWDTVHAWNPRLIYVSMSGCGHDGPWQHVISYAPTVHALCGITHLTNFADQRDLGPGYSLNDSLAGYAAAVTVMAAIVERDRTGLGQRIDMAQLEIGTYCIGPALIEWFANGTAREPDGNVELGDAWVNEVFAAADGASVAVTIVDAQEAAQAVSVLGASGTDQASVRTALQQWIAARPGAEAMAALQAERIAAGVIQHADVLFDSDPQLKDRGFWEVVDHAGFGERGTDTFPALIDGQRLGVELPTPAYLGEHNMEVWSEVAGLSEEQVAIGMATGLFE